MNCLDIAKIIKSYNLTDNIVVKMDVEGAEYALLTDILKKDALRLIDFIAVEFHPQLSPFERPEDVFVKFIEMFGLKFMKWQ